MKQPKGKKATIRYATDAATLFSKKDRNNTAFIYVRISREDEKDGDSYSIQNQTELLVQTATAYGYTILVIFMDDGITGVSTKRPGFLDMLSKLERGYAAALFVKDLSRLYRNRTEADRLVDDFLPEHEIRLVSVGDGIDSAEGSDEFIFLRNWANEQYARDISNKRRLSNKVRGNAGEPLSPPPYGYMKDPADPKRWIVDDEAAAVVRRVFSMTLDGYGTEQIAAALTADKLLTPVFYWKSKGINRPGKVKEGREPHCWNSSTIISILSKQEYCGDVINFKTYSTSFKDKTRRENAPDNIKVFDGAHDPIVDRGIWEQVQQKRGRARKRVNRTGEKNMFSGLLRCADCGGNLNYHFNQGNHDIKYFNCANYNSRRQCDSTHYIRVDFLEQVVMGEIRRLTQFASRYENDFVKAAIGQSQQTAEAERAVMRKTLQTLQKRDKEIDTLFSRLYEDNLAGKISDGRFAKLTEGYEAEQAELAERIKALCMELDKAIDQTAGTDIFIARVRKYTRAKKLTERMLTELIDHIEVYHAEKVDGVKTQRLRIHYACVGSIEVPDVLQLSQPQVLLQTRKGVAISYSDSQKVVNL